MSSFECPVCGKEFWGSTCSHCLKSMTTLEFDTRLREILKDMTGEELLDIPGVYEAVSEYFNNEVLDNWYNDKVMEVGYGQREPLQD